MAVKAAVEAKMVEAKMVGAQGEKMVECLVAARTVAAAASWAVKAALEAPGVLMGAVGAVTRPQW